MNWSRPVSTITMSPDQYRVLFQVTKELPVLPTTTLEAAGADPADVDQILALARDIRSRLGGASAVVITVTAEDRPGPAAPRGVEAAEIRAAVPGRLASTWQALAAALIPMLGARELFLRTGYSPEEAQRAVNLLDAPP
jgi:hypothetical protein